MAKAATAAVSQGRAQRPVAQSESLGVPEHVHKWEMGGVTIDTAPPTYTWYCSCGVATHDRETAKPCEIGHYDNPFR